jgi:DNA-binding beta-propeller fold protein YncE
VKDQPTTRRDWLKGVGGAATFGFVARNAAAGEVPPDRGPKRDVLFVANRRSGTVSLVETETFENVRTIDVLPDGEEPSATGRPVDRTAYPAVTAFAGENFAEHVAVSPDGRTLYVSRGHRADVAAFDVESGDLLWKVPVSGRRADHMAISDGGGSLVVSSMSADAVEVIDVERAAIVGSFPAKNFPHGVHYTHDGDRIVNGSLGNMLVPDDAERVRSARRADGRHRLTVADAETLEVERTFEFEDGVRPFALTEDDRRAFLQLSYFHGFVEFDLERGRRLRTVHLPVSDEWRDRPRGDYPNEAAHHGIQLSPDGEYVCAAGMVDGYVALVSRPDLQVDSIVDVGGHPGWATNGPDGRHCFVADRQNGVVSVISYARGDEVARVAVDDDPAVMDVAAVPRDVL